MFYLAFYNKKVSIYKQNKKGYVYLTVIACEAC